MACSHRDGNQSCSADCPQPNLHALSQHKATEKPRLERTREGPLDEPCYPDHHQ